mgnify:CR=1 FL=1
MALTAGLTDYSIISLISSGELVGVKTYQELVNVTLGKTGYVLLVTIQFLYPFICMCPNNRNIYIIRIPIKLLYIFSVALISYNIIIGDTVTKVLIRLLNVPAHSFLVNRYLIIALFTLFVTLPLSLLRDISKLAKTSFISCVMVIAIAAAMFYRLFTIDAQM